MFPNNPYSLNGYSATPQYGQVQTPAMPQLNNLQQAQTTTQQSMQTIQNGSLYGRVVGTLDEIVPNDVPRDGSIGLFPQRDYSCIFAKQWNNDGSISTIKFVPEPVQQQDDQQTAGVGISDIMDRLDSIENMLRQQKKPYHNQKRNRYDENRNAKVEVSDNVQSD